MPVHKRKTKDLMKRMQDKSKPLVRTESKTRTSAPDLATGLAAATRQAQRISRPGRTSDPNLEPGLASATRRAQRSGSAASMIKKSEELQKAAMKRRYAQMLRKRRGSGGASRQFPD